MKSIRFFLLFSSALCSLLLPASGNGGGYLHGVKFTGALAPFEPSGVERVQILDERLNITIDDTGADVVVNYVMKNITKRRANVTFGFPIEARHLGHTGVIASKTEVTWKRSKKELAALTEAAGKYTAGYKVVVGGDVIAHTDITEPFSTGEIEPFTGSEALEGLVGWKISSLKFAAGQERKVTISYRAAHEQGGTTMSNRSYNLAPIFRYRLSTGGVWAGPIAKGRVEVRFVGANAKWCEIKQPTRRFRKLFKEQGGALVWEFANLEPTFADDLEIVAGPSNGVYYIKSPSGDTSEDPRPKQYIKTGDRWQMLHQEFKATASSILPPDEPYRYGANNVAGHDIRSGAWDYAWSEGVPGDGIGESITLTVDKPLPLDALKIHPGFCKDTKLYLANGRPSRLKITLNGEHTFMADLADRNESQGLAVTGYDRPVKTVRIEIAKVYKGNKFADTCISDIRLITRLDGKPKMKGSR